MKNKTSISCHTSTRKRIKFASEADGHEDYDSFLNVLLNNAGYPTAEEYEALAKKKRDERAAPEVTA